jgi:NAD(P)-dependent dehydrogenase (short-subunit alcohol dehydrogenase family)
MKLQNKIAVITGGNSGIGLATAHEFKAQGARVVLIGRKPDAVAAAAKEIGGDTLGLVADVAKVAELDAVFQTIRKEHGRIDVLFANAGIAKFAPLADSSEEFFLEQMATNVKGAYFTVQKALPLLSEGASVIFTSSTVSHFGMPGSSVYSMTKAALINLAKTLAVELAGKKIRVNVVSPGPISTPIFGKMGLSEAAVGELGGAILAQVPLARFGEPTEIAKAVAFLASSDAAYVTGTELLVDGGMAQL